VHICSMKARLLIIFFTLLGFLAPAQSSVDDNNAKLKTLSDKAAEYHRKTNGESDGYRIKIHFGMDKTAANEVKQKFSSKYNSISTYVDYQQPNWVVVVGDFKTRIDAYEIFKKIQLDFPNAFIVKSKIRPTR
jgi:hypothetical protein